MPTNNELKLLITSEISGLKSGMADAQSAVNGATSQMTSSFQAMDSSLGSIATSIKGQFTAVAATIAAAFATDKIAGMIKDITLAAARYEMLGAVMTVVGNNAGYTGKQMEDFAQDLQKTGISMTESRQSLTRMAQAQLDLNQASKLARGAQDAARIGNINSSEAFQRMILGIQRGETEILKTIGVNVNFENSYKKVADATGRATTSFTEAEKTNIRMMATVEALGRITGTYSTTMEMAGGQALSLTRHLENLKVLAGEAFTPIFAEMIKAITEAITDLNGALKSGSEKIAVFGNSLASLFLEIRAVAAMMAGAIITAFAAIGDYMGGAAAAAVRLAQRDFRGAWVAISEGVKDAKKEIIDYGNTVALIANDTYGRIEKMWASGPASVADKKLGSGTDEAVGKPKEAKSRAPDWKNELEQMKEAENAYFNFSVDREKAFWEGKLALSKKGSEEYRTVQHELFEIAKKQAKDATDAEIAEIKTQQASDKTSWMQKLALEDQKLAALGKRYGKDNAAYRTAVMEKRKLEEEAAKASIASNQKIIESQLKGAESVMAITEIENRTRAELGAISTKKEIELNRQALDEIYNMKLAALSREAELYKDQPVKYQEMLEKIEELERTHNVNMAKSQQSLALDQKKRWDSFMAPIKSALNSSVQGIIQGTTTLKQAFQNLATSILTSMGNMLIQLGLDWAEQQAMQLLGIGTTQAAETAAAATTVATTTATSAVVIPAKAAEAGAGAAASQAFIPFIGPALALAAMAAVFGAVMALKSAAGGYDIPAGTNPITQLHSEEMVLPASTANNIRNMTNQGGGRATITATSDITVPILTSIQTILAKSQTILQETLGITKDARKLEVTKEIQSGNIMGVALGKMLPIPFAADGWDVDKGGLTIIHDKEMVLPSHLAEGVRNMTARGGGGGGGNVTFNVNAFDSKDVGAFFKKHGSSIANSLKGPQRSFQLNTVLGKR